MYVAEMSPSVVSALLVHVGGSLDRDQSLACRARDLETGIT
jgi:hypothetical protein